MNEPTYQKEPLKRDTNMIAQQQKALSGSIVSFFTAILAVVLAFFLESFYIKIILTFVFFSGIYSIILGIRSKKYSAVIISLLPLVLVFIAFVLTFFAPNVTGLFGLI
ncbi:MAG: hypothetical protein P4L74_03770 [Candidatus Doudnabacteria bacterium]|nr:hypothetical protein [Candidatus Doudnabacteria bacterium]